MKSGKILLGVLAGAAAGALMGILFAPEKGERTRRKMLNKGQDYADDLKDKFNDFVETITEKYESKKQEAEELISKEKVILKDAKKEFNNATA